jgi:hypothetical protein
MTAKTGTVPSQGPVRLGTHPRRVPRVAPWTVPASPGLPLFSRVIVSQARPWGRRQNVHCNSHRSSHRIRHRNGHRVLDWTLTCISTWILNRISTLTSTCVRRCTTSCYRTRSAHRFRSCSAASSSRRPARSSFFSTSTSTFTWPYPDYGGGIGGVAARREDRGLKIEDLGRDLAVGGTYTIMYILRTRG